MSTTWTEKRWIVELTIALTRLIEATSESTSCDIQIERVQAEKLLAMALSSAPQGEQTGSGG